MVAYNHIPVMLNEVIHYLNCRPGKIYADCTLGGAGHTRAVLEKIMPDGFLIGLDQDNDAIHHAEEILEPYHEKIRLFHSNYIYLPDILSQLNICGVDGILLDLGLSLHHLEASGRGFSFKRDEPLDMRMNTESEMTAEYLINNTDQEGLQKIFKEYGEERWAGRIARKIVTVRKNKKIASSKELAQIVCEAIPKKGGNQKIHPATRVFMAIRIAVNKELERLDRFMKNVADLLNPGGRLCILSFHSLEDRIVKHRIKALEKGCICPPPRAGIALPCSCNRKPTMRILTKKPVCPTEAEIAINPMSRSTKLRASERI
jgi:16S rRNA (cytosine1402-N4)-methyltransferase